MRESPPRGGTCPSVVRGSVVSPRWAALLLPALIAGCPPTDGRVPFTTRREALEHVNNNLAQITQPLSCAALVSFKFRGGDERVHAFYMHEARLIFAPPKSLLFDVRTLAGTAAQFGSNDAQYWLWLDVADLRKLWWGSWHRISALTERKLPVPPNELLDALLLRPLPEALEGGQLPVLRAEEGDYRLIFMRLGGGGQPTGWREVRFDTRPPYQPVEIVDRTPDGEIAMRAQLMNYQRVGAEGPLTPRRYVVVWPANEAEMRLDILSAKFRSELPEGTFDFPANWQGESEEIDALAGGASQP